VLTRQLGRDLAIMLLLARYVGWGLTLRILRNPITAILCTTYVTGLRPWWRRPWLWSRLRMWRLWTLSWHRWAVTWTTVAIVAAIIVIICWHGVSLRP
jgi:hypothetical protein